MLRITSPSGNENAAPPSEVQARYTFAHGLLLRHDGRTAPVSLDHVERAYGRDALDSIMENAGTWIDIMTPAPVPAFRCRCWADHRGDVVTILTPLGKATLNVCHVQSEALAGRTGLRDLFNLVLDADRLARRLTWKNDGSDKAYIELEESEMALLAIPPLKLITRAVRHVDLSKFGSPPDRPAA